MSKIEKIASEDVKDIIRLAQPYYEKKSEPQNFTKYISIKTPFCDLALSKTAFSVPHGLPKYGDGPDVFLLLKEPDKSSFVCNIDTQLLRTAVLDVVDQFVDRSKYSCCYQRVFKSIKKEVVIANRHVLLGSLEHATRLLLLCGIEQAELYDTDGSLCFAGRHKNEFVVVVTVGKKKRLQTGEKCPVVSVLSGGLSFGASSEIHADLIRDYIKTLDAVNKTAEKNDYLFNEIYCVTLVKHTDVFVVAHSKEEAEDIAIDNAYDLDTSDDEYEVDYSSESSIDAVPERGDCRVYCEDGPVSCKEFHELVKNGGLLVEDYDDEGED